MGLEPIALSYYDLELETSYSKRAKMDSELAMIDLATDIVFEFIRKSPL